MVRFLIVFDGGSKGNPGPAYGSYRIRPWVDRRGKVDRLRFGTGTNNEAEYLSLIAAVRALRAFLDGRGVAPQEAEVEIHGDSQLVMRQVSGEWKAKDKRMQAFRDEVQSLLEPFGEVHLREEPRERIVDALGH